MKVEQAAFTSMRTSHACGYHLVARSPGICEELARQLSRWGPSHASLLDRGLDAASLSFFPLGNEWFAVARSVYGAPEYSQRGGLQVVTMFLVLRREQWAGYDDNPLALATTVGALGHLRLLPELPERLPTVDIPDRQPIGMAAMEPPNAHDLHLVEEMLNGLEKRDRIAVVGLPEPLLALQQIFRRTPRTLRLQLSFTTGLRPSVHRPFQLHFLAAATAAYCRELASQGIRCVSGLRQGQERLAIPQRVPVAIHDDVPRY